MTDLIEVKGYKAFNKDHTNRHGMIFESGKTYRAEGPISFGNNSLAGFHLCQNLEDTLRYFPAMKEEITIAQVTGRGDIVEYFDNYYDYYDMYAVEELTIEKFLTRREIIRKFLFDNDMYTDRVCRFTQRFKLTSDEIELFKLRYGTNIKIMDYIAYYQEGKKDIFEKKYYR